MSWNTETSKNLRLFSLNLLPFHCRIFSSFWWLSFSKKICWYFYESDIELYSIHWHLHWLLVTGPVLFGKKSAVWKIYSLWCISTVSRHVSTEYIEWCSWKTWNCYDSIPQKAFANREPPNIVYRTTEFGNFPPRTAEYFDTISISRVHSSVEPNFFIHF